ncbi:hypothetical protein BLA29_009355 [Euroglyphus maynei]|uniref:Transmembrane protein n=1 Tax=Euroglyphus maynei TaxID=6958 RepID=A0A1Y3ATR0_EURMA|nr:hypothetical protein BLA29_009355 [Euroglyphus maynei]
MMITVMVKLRLPFNDDIVVDDDDDDDDGEGVVKLSLLLITNDGVDGSLVTVIIGFSVLALFVSIVIESDDPLVTVVRFQ